VSCVATGRALVLVHDPDATRWDAGIGTVGPALAALGFEVVVSTLVTGVVGPDPADVDVVVVLGAAESAYDDRVPWLAAELDLVAAAVRATIPVLGICFGAQVLARVLGGDVGRAPRSERGFVTLGSDDPELLEAGAWMEFHDDAFTLPPGGLALAANETGVQAFTLGPHLGVQFHPEITPTVFAMWEQVWTQRGIGDAMAAAVDLPALRAEIATRAPASADAGRRLVERFCARAGVACA
jgi:GMP synthase-like glutamine amidotransferase